MDRAGNFYGTTLTGGEGQVGTVFKMTRRGSGWIFATLYSFHGPDGSNPQARVIIGPDGSLYGTTTNGGSANQGTVFRLQPPASFCRAVVCPWTETVVHSFQGGSDGRMPTFGDLTFDQAGNIYGTTPNGGATTGCNGLGCGTVYKLTPSNGGWTESILYNCQPAGGPQVPYGGVIFDAAGNLYGASVAGGAAGGGAVFKLTPSAGGWTESVIYSFTDGADGGNPYGGLIIDQAGNLYGMTNLWGQGDGGTAYELTPSGGGWSFHLLYSFTAYVGSVAKLAMDPAGNLYGTLGDSDTQVFRLTPSNGGWTETSFNGGLGAGLLGNVVLDASGNIYTTAGGGVSGDGVVFEITP